MLVRSMRNQIRRDGTDLDDDTGLALSENGPRPAKTSSLNSDRVRSFRGRTVAGLSTDMTRRSRDIDILHATADEHHDILENVPPFQSQDGSADTRRSIPIRGIHRPLDHDDHTPRFRRNGRTPSAVRASNGPINQPSPEATVADFKGILNRSVRQSPPFNTLISPPESSTSSYDDDLPQIRSRRFEALKKLHDAISQIPQHREEVDTGLLSLQQGRTQDGGTTPGQHTEELLLKAGINPSTLNSAQFASFQNQSPAVQQKTIQTYAANLEQQQSQQMGKPMPTSNTNSPPGQGRLMVGQAPNGATMNSFYDAEGMAPAPPGAMMGTGQAPQGGQGGNANPASQPNAPGAKPLPMFLPHQMDKIPQLSTEEKQRYKKGLSQLWTALKTASAGSVQQREAEQKIRDFSGQLLNKLRERQRVNAGQAQQNQNTQAGNSQDTGGADSAAPPPDASHSARSEVPLKRRIVNSPGFPERGRDINRKDNNPKSTTNATISRDHTMGAEARRVELLRNWGGKMKLVTGPSLPADSNSDTSYSSYESSSP